MQLRDALKRATSLMEQIDRGLGGNERTEYKLYLWNDLEDGGTLQGRSKYTGLRIAEVSSWTPREDDPRLGGGGSYMQMDLPHGACVCRRVEELLLCYIEEWEDQPEVELFPVWEAEESVVRAMFDDEGVKVYIATHDWPYNDPKPETVVNAG